jgi:tetratricopeptide (TPR) repeat protein
MLRPGRGFGSSLVVLALASTPAPEGHTPAGAPLVGLDAREARPAGLRAQRQGAPESEKAGAAEAGAVADSDAFALELARGDERYALRGAGATGARALPGPVEEAIDSYRRALSLRPDSAEARARLLRALFFRATFCGASLDERRRLFQEARGLAEDGVARLEGAVGGTKGEQRRAALRALPGATRLLLWAAIAWGEWAQLQSRLAAARAGAPGRIRDLAEQVIELDPALEEGGGFRVLGRLHDQSPKIPFVTGFVSRGKAVALLRKAYETSPINSVNRFFLADALLRHERRSRPEALRLLETLASSDARPEYRVEDAHYAGLASELLARSRPASAGP